MPRLRPLTLVRDLQVELYEQAFYDRPLFNAPSSFYTCLRITFELLSALRKRCLSIQFPAAGSTMDI
jgi:hypothetical protein